MCSGPEDTRFHARDSPCTMECMGDAIIRVGSDGESFDAGGRAFVPWGCNYYDPFTGWAPRLWELFDPVRVAEQFAHMQSIGVNVVRVFSTIVAVLEASDRPGATASPGSRRCWTSRRRMAYASSSQDPASGKGPRPGGTRPPRWTIS